jgi:hypothetical protein
MPAKDADRNGSEWPFNPQWWRIRKRGSKYIIS